jgi:hypothetical protein
METVIADDPATRGGLAAWMRARGKERRERIWFRDAQAAEAVDAILFVGLLPGWYPPNYDCGACGYATCAEFLNHTSTLLTAPCRKPTSTPSTCPPPEPSPPASRGRSATAGRETGRNPATRPIPPDPDFKAAGLVPSSDSTPLPERSVLQELDS